jgi:endonuclease YncB( thermonuclease family)
MFLNAEEVRQGYARAYTSYRFRYSREFRAYEVEAHDGKRGLWATGDLP